MWLGKYLLENYGKDPEVTHLLIQRQFTCVRSTIRTGITFIFNSQSNRSTVRPVDNDGDGLLDEDAPDDLDNNGIIHTMRWKDEKKGKLIPDPKDLSGRIMKRVEPGKGIYLSSSEGIDNDNDGRINEDGIGGLDLHRNYPENWRPQKEENRSRLYSGRSRRIPPQRNRNTVCSRILLPIRISMWLILWIPVSQCTCVLIQHQVLRNVCILKTSNGTDISMNSGKN
jgi:hypothetical protein